MSPKQHEHEQEETPGEVVSDERQSLSGLRRVALITMAGLLCLSVLGRATLGTSPTDPGAQTPTRYGAQGIVADQGGGPPAEPRTPITQEQGTIETLLPYLTESSFFGLIGFALGYASRKVVKIGLVFLAIFFVMLQVLSYAGVATVDWARAIELVNALILNLRDNQTLLEVLKDKVPTTGAMAGGYFLGFRRG